MQRLAKAVSRPTMPASDRIPKICVCRRGIPLAVVEVVLVAPQQKKQG
jgi:hypothetical protein